MASESEQQDSGAVDRAISCLNDALKELKALSAGESSEDKEESSEEDTPRDKQPKSLKGAEKEAFRRMRAARASSDASK